MLFDLPWTAYADLVSCIEAIKKKSENHRAKSEKFEIAPAQALEQQRSRVGAWPPRNLKLEDQDGNVLRWDAFFGHKPTLLAYFYTRCGNPYKCTRTILNLSLIQDEIEHRGLSGRVRISAISYDSQFDTPAALKSYGDARNFQFNDDCRMFRVSEGFGQLIEQMELEVSYLQSQVSSHRIELFVIDASGDVLALIQSGASMTLNGDDLFELKRIGIGADVGRGRFAAMCSGLESGFKRKMGRL